MARICWLRTSKLQPLDCIDSTHFNASQADPSATWSEAVAASGPDVTTASSGVKPYLPGVTCQSGVLSHPVSACDRGTPITPSSAPLCDCWCHLDVRRKPFLERDSYGAWPVVVRYYE